MLTASTTKSEVGTARRPKPPPAIIVFSVTCSGFRPAVVAAAAWSPVWNCEPTHSVQWSSLKSTVQLIGSIGAWARYGNSYIAWIVFATGALARVAGAVFATAPGDFDSSA